MATSAKELYESALSLDDLERAELVGLLLASLEVDPEPGVEKAWNDEFARRVAELDSGEVKAISWAKVQSKVFEATDH
jgi:putative addiction module component (TIGR02574 family)